MKVEDFWAIIAKGKDDDDPKSVVKEELVRLSPRELVSYQEHFDYFHEKAYRWNLWGAAYIIHGGCSDDGFIDFRYGLISKGKEVYENALADPDSLASVKLGEEISDELFGYIALDLYENATGEDMPRKPFAAEDPEGEEWDFDDEDENARKLPKLWEKYDENWI